MKVNTVKKKKLASYKKQILEFINKITDYTIRSENIKYDKQKILSIFAETIEKEEKQIYINIFNDIYNFCLEDYTEVIARILKNKTIKTFDKRLSLIEFYKSYTEELLSNMISLYSIDAFSNYSSIAFETSKINIYSKISQVLSQFIVAIEILSQKYYMKNL